MNGVRPSMVLLAVVLAAAAGLATGAWWGERGDPRWPSYAELFEQAAPSVVNVSVEGGEHRLGSGFAVAADEVLTSDRVALLRRWAYGLDQAPDDFICKGCVFALRR